MIKKARGHLLHSLGGPSGSRVVVSEAEHAARQQKRYDRRNASRRSAFAKSNLASDWVRSDPDPATAWTLDHSVTTAETAGRRRSRLDSELAKIGEE